MLTSKFQVILSLSCHCAIEIIMKIRYRQLIADFCHHGNTWAALGCRLTPIDCSESYEVIFFVRPRIVVCSLVKAHELYFFSCTWPLSRMI